MYGKFDRFSKLVLFAIVSHFRRLGQKLQLTTKHVYYVTALFMVIGYLFKLFNICLWIQNILTKEWVVLATVR